MMKKILMMTCILALISTTGFAGTDFVLNLSPGFILYSPDAEGFKVSDGWKTEETEGYISNTAILGAGVGFETPDLFFDMTGGVGYLWSSSVKAKLVMMDFACRFKLHRDEMTLGPHLSIMKYKPDWGGDTDISLGDDTAVSGGLSFTIGSKPFSIMAALDYISLSFDVESPGIAIDGGSLDLSGIALQIGLLFRF
ncbi:MAG: hypothetical protein BWK80_30070 [Desulfobacteraceae bacterium IS3]|nr:MAG: hypothetical protein BWK80_30070 [Desulfobacteraceae bacterium IS3]